MLEWNRLLLTTLSTPGATQPTVFFTRGPALMHVAIFDALNSFDRTYTPYLTYVNVPTGASRDAAVAQAAHDTLAAMYPTQRRSTTPPWPRTSGGCPRTRRASAHWSAPPPHARSSNCAPTTAGSAGRRRTFAGHGWLLAAHATGQRRSSVHALPRRRAVRDRQREPVSGRSAPVLTSRRYADDFNEVKAIGGAASTTRTADQTLVARLFAVVPTVTTTGIPDVWNNLVRDLVRARGLDDIAAARLYALVNTTFHDALYVSFSGKYLYGLWRPVTAIREAARDANPDTEPDPAFLPLITTPPYPSYPGNYACLAAGISRVLEPLLRTRRHRLLDHVGRTSGAGHHAVLRRLPSTGRRSCQKPGVWRHPFQVRHDIELRRVRAAGRLRVRQHVAQALVGCGQFRTRNSR